MAENKRYRGQERNQSSRQPKTTIGLKKGAPKTTETGAQNNGGQTHREGDKMERQKHGGHRE